MHLRSRKKFGFGLIPLHRKREPHAFHYLKQRVSFWIAAFSLVAFVAGNMMGQHGWYAFWKSVMGSMDDSLIVYTGTVAPIEKVPDYERWAQYGGNVEDHTFRQAPQDILMTLPRYSSVRQRRKDILHGHGSDVYSVGYLGSYSTGAESSGSHPGIDIRTPVGTQVQAIANGFVVEVKEDGGFGKVVVLRHPNAPDPMDPSKTSVIFSSYAHLNAIYVSEGEIVHKGEHIADSGKTGLASGPHLHFQIDRDEAPWHPYWPFTSKEARRDGLTFNEAVNKGLFQSRGYLYTVNPMLYVQANYDPVDMTIAEGESSTLQEKPKEPVVLTYADRLAKRVARMLTRREERLRERIARRGDEEVEIAQVTETVAPPLPEPKEEPEVLPPVEEPKPVVVSTETIATTSMTPVAVASVISSDVATVHIRHDGNFSGRDWEKVTIMLLDKQGNPVANPNLNSDLYLRTAYGSAEFRPGRLSPLDFVEGEASVSVLPRGRRTVVIQVQPFNVMSEPLRYSR